MSLINVETLIAADHPSRVIKRMCDQVLESMDSHFDEIYARHGAPSIPPETLLKGKVLQWATSIRAAAGECTRVIRELKRLTLGAFPAEPPPLNVQIEHAFIEGPTDLRPRVPTSVL